MFAHFCQLIDYNKVSSVLPGSVCDWVLQVQKTSFISVPENLFIAFHIKNLTCLLNILTNILIVSPTIFIKKKPVADYSGYSFITIM